MEVFGSHEAKGHCNYTVGFGWAIQNDCRAEWFERKTVKTTALVFDL